MERQIKTTQRAVTRWQPDLTTTADLRTWLLTNAPAGSYWLLAHQENVVIWGKITEDPATNSRTLTTADQAPLDVGKGEKAAIPPLRLELLLHCRLFGLGGELLLWRTEEGWQARSYQEADDQAALPTAAAVEYIDTVEYIDEEQILWGTQREEATAATRLPAGFTLVADGAEGLRHAIPLTGLGFAQDQPRNLYRPLRLKVRHYLAQDGDGMLYIGGSRLVNLVVYKGA